MTPATNSKLSGGRLAAVIAGGTLTLIGLLFALIGAGLLWAEDHKDRDGYYTTGSERFSTSTYAVTTDDLDVDGVPSGNVLGKVRLRVRDEGGEPVFVGIARTGDVDAYLAGSAHAKVTDLDFSPFDPDYATSAGARAPERPGSQTFWAASAEGAGTQTLDWDVSNGHWSVVVMNADGSEGVTTMVDAGANVPLVHDLMVAALIAALTALIGGGGLIAGAFIRPPQQPSWPAGSASAA